MSGRSLQGTTPRASYLIRFGLLGALLTSLGCGAPLTREQLTKEILKADPEFRWVLERHRNLSSKIHTYEQELALKRSAVEQNIAKLRQELATNTAGVKHKIAEVKQQMWPEQQRLALALAEAGEELRARRFQRSSVGRSITQLKKSLAATRSTWTSAERAQQEAKINERLEDAKRLDGEIASIKTHMRLIKIKSLLIKL